MFCPKCETEYPRHVMVCPTCDVDTVDRLPGPAPTPDAELVRVFTTADLALTALARSLLDGEAIDYFVKGDSLQDLFGVGRSTGFGSPTRGVEFWVRADDEERTRELLEAVSASDQRREPSGDSES
jgi:hypothetical protein